MRALAGAFVLLALGVLAAPSAEAQTYPAVPGLSASPVAGSHDKLDVSWNAPTGVTFDIYYVRWKTGSQEYGAARQTTANPPATTAQITGLTASTEYDIQVSAIDLLTGTAARSETSATTNATTVDYRPYFYLVQGDGQPEGTTRRFELRLIDATTGMPVSPPAGGLTVNLTVSDTTVAGADFLAAATEGAKTVTFAEGESSVWFSVPTVDDNQDEPNGQITVTLVAAAGYSLGTNDSQSSSVTDNDAVAGLRLWVEDSDLTRGTSSSHLDIAESGGRQAFTTTVWLIGEDGKPVARSSNTNVSVQYSHVDTTSADINLYLGANTVQVPAGRTYVEQLDYLTPIADTVQEDPERFNYTASVTVDGKTFTDTVALYFVDDGWEDPIATIAAGTSPVVEGTPATFTVTLSQAVSTAVNVNYNIWWEGSFSDPDRTSVDAPRSVEIAAAATTATITVPTHNDTDDEPDGHVKVGLVNGRHYQLHQYRNSYKWAEVIVTDNDPSSSPPTGGRQEPTGAAALTGLTVSSVAGKPAQLAVVWEAVEGAATYSVRWKTGSGDYGDPVEASTNSHTVTGLSAGTTYTVNVAALDSDNTLLAEGTASGTTAAATGNSGGQTQQGDDADFVIYHDPAGGAAAVDRYGQATALLNASERSYAVRTVTGTAEVDPLAGVTGSVMPRFFLGDPAAPGWGPSQPRVNNGGLRWLRSMLGASQASSVRGATGATGNHDAMPGALSARPRDEVAAVFERAVLEASGLLAGRHPVLVDMSLLFDLADPGTTVDYTVSSSDGAVLAVHTAATDPTLAGPVLRLAPMTAGEATVTVTAEAAAGGAAVGRVAASTCAGACASVDLTVWDAAVPALPVVGQLLLAALMAVGGYRRYRRR